MRLVLAFGLAFVAEAGRGAAGQSFRRSPFEPCACPGESTSPSVEVKWSTKATGALAGVGMAAKFWKALPKGWRRTVGDKVVEAIAWILPTAILAPLLRHGSLIDFIIKLGRTLLFGVVHDL
mmetsp:Transcript_33040/g.105449  ORF Transcript_33040/g.105449 Transcript_33040/m.105449 type:complete len:122 (+) Transcript_33040:35-400(+)